MDERILMSPDEYLKTDNHFNKLYPAAINQLSGRHWTPIYIAQLAASFLASAPGSKILDIGSGVGKFCLTAARYAPNNMFYGIEQRENLVEYALKAQQILHISNVSFLKGNFTDLNLKDYNHFYFFNSFYENLHEEGRIDENVAHSKEIYEANVRHLHSALKEMPKGTKIVTYHSNNEEIPLSYNLVETLESGELHFWIKK